MDQAPRRELALNHTQGVYLVPDSFGSPSDIGAEKREALDSLRDEDYLYAVLELTPGEITLLMRSERERRRSFATHWPLEHIVKGHDLAKEGFYYTGTGDHVQCAFCDTIHSNWNVGDLPRQDNGYFCCCKKILGQNSTNIPYVSGDAYKDNLRNPRHSNKPVNLGLRVFCKRKDSFTSCSKGIGVPYEKIARAGFYLGSDGKVTCFWCGGSLELRTLGTDSWIEHARWFPGCAFLKREKGEAFIKDIRSKMLPADLELAKTMTYNCGDLNFLDGTQPEVNNLSSTDSPSEYVDVERLVRMPNLTENDSEQLVKAMICHICDANQVGAVILPCGHFCICQSCSETYLPSTCPYCAGQVKGACKAFLS